MLDSPLLMDPVSGQKAFIVRDQGLGIAIRNL